MPEYNKITFNGKTIDLTSDTVTAADVANSKRFHLPSGVITTGTLEFITCYTGTSDPSSSLGQDGDVYLKVSS